MLVTKGRVNSHALGRHQGHNQKGQKPGDEEEENPGRMPGKSLFFKQEGLRPALHADWRQQSFDGLIPANAHGSHVMTLR